MDNMGRKKSESPHAAIRSQKQNKTPRRALIIGSGRLSSHLRHYLSSRKISWDLWTRQDELSPFEKAQSFKPDIALLAVSDGAIEHIASSLPKSLIKIHFSGRFSSNEILGIHPLMSFTHRLFEASFYDRIPLVISPDLIGLNWIKALPNPLIEIQAEQKALYHGLCHLAGNFPKMLWSEVAQAFEKQLGIPRSFLKPYLEEILNQVMESREDIHVGAFGRKDFETIQSHLESLNDFPQLKNTYNQFYESYKDRSPDEPA